MTELNSEVSCAIEHVIKGTKNCFWGNFGILVFIKKQQKWAKSIPLTIQAYNILTTTTYSNPFFAVESVFDTLKVSAHVGVHVAGSSPGPPPDAIDVVTPPQLTKEVYNYTSECRPDPSFPESDTIAAYAGLVIMFIMAIYAR